MPVSRKTDGMDTADGETSGISTYRQQGKSLEWNDSAGAVSAIFAVGEEISGKGLQLVRGCGIIGKRIFADLFGRP